MKIQSYRDLEVWRAGMALTKLVYASSRALPKEELFGLTSQMRRAAVSIPTNIAEGSGRQTTKDLLHFLSVARGSLRELETLILVADGEYQIPDGDLLLGQCEPIGRMLTALMNSLGRKAAKKVS